MASGERFEHSLQEPKSCVLPLDDPEIVPHTFNIYTNKCQIKNRFAIRGHKAVKVIYENREYYTRYF